MGRGCLVVSLFVLAGCQGPMSGSAMFAPNQSARVPAPKTGRFKASNSGSYYQRQNQSPDIQRTGPQEATAPSPRSASSDNRLKGPLKWLPTNGVNRSSYEQPSTRELNESKGFILNPLPVNDATRIEATTPPESGRRLRRSNLFIEEGNERPLESARKRPIGTGVRTPPARQPRRGKVETIDISNYPIRQASAETPDRERSPEPKPPTNTGGWKPRWK